MARTVRRAITSMSLPKGPVQDVAAAEFKATCLELMDWVKTGVEYVFTKHGRPIAKLVPFTSSASTTFFGSMKGTVLAYHRPFDPIDGEYDVNRE